MLEIVDIAGFAILNFSAERLSSERDMQTVLPNGQRAVVNWDNQDRTSLKVDFWDPEENLNEQERIFLAPEPRFSDRRDGRVIQSVILHPGLFCRCPFWSKPVCFLATVRVDRSRLAPAQRARDRASLAQLNEAGMPPGLSPETAISTCFGPNHVCLLGGLLFGQPSSCVFVFTGGAWRIMGNLAYDVTTSFSVAPDGDALYVIGGAHRANSSLRNTAIQKINFATGLIRVVGLIPAVMARETLRPVVCNGRMYLFRTNFQGASAELNNLNPNKPRVSRWRTFAIDDSAHVLARNAACLVHDNEIWLANRRLGVFTGSEARWLCCRIVLVTASHRAQHRALGPGSRYACLLRIHCEWVRWGRALRERKLDRCSRGLSCLRRVWLI